MGSSELAAFLRTNPRRFPLGNARGFVLITGLFETRVTSSRLSREPLLAASTSTRYHLVRTSVKPIRDRNPQFGAAIHTKPPRCGKS